MDIKVISTHSFFVHYNDKKKNAPFSPPPPVGQCPIHLLLKKGSEEEALVSQEILWTPNWVLLVHFLLLNNFSPIHCAWCATWKLCDQKPLLSYNTKWCIGPHRQHWHVWDIKSHQMLTRESIFPTLWCLFKERRCYLD